MHSSGRCWRRKREVRSLAQSQDPCLLSQELDLQTEAKTNSNSCYHRLYVLFFHIYSRECAYVSGVCLGLCRCCHCCCPGWCSSGSDRWPPTLGWLLYQDCRRCHVLPACVHPDGLGSHSHPDLVHPAAENVSFVLNFLLCVYVVVMVSIRSRS